MPNVTLVSTDQTVQVEIKAGFTGGIKEIDFISPPFPPLTLTEQEAIDKLAPCIRQIMVDANAPPTGDKT